MLSLKHTSFPTSLHANRVLTDLPSEVLDLVLRHVYYASGEHISSVIPASLTCRALRLSACPILFEVLTIVLEENVIKRRSWVFLQHLLAHPHLLKHVRCLQVQEGLVPSYLMSSIESDSARFGRGLSKRTLLDCIDRMTGLRSVRFYHISDIMIEVLGRLLDTNSIDIAFDLSHTRQGFTATQYIQIHKMLGQSSNWHCSLSLPPSMHIGYLAVVELVMSSRCKAINWLDNWVPLKMLAEATYSFTHLEELHVSSRLLEAQTHLLSPNFIPWPALKRLHVEGDRQIKHLFNNVIDQLISLTSLQLYATTSDAFHDDCLEASLNRSHHHYSGPSSSSSSSINPNIFFPLPYTRLPNLRHLELRSICSHFPITHLTTPTLRTLKLILPEYHARMRSLTEARPPSDLKHLSNPAILPHLTHLELHVGPLENLWHPTAIPGVDINPEIYTTLTLLAAIPNLRTLRLFPPYVPTRQATSSPSSNPSQPSRQPHYQQSLLHQRHHHLANARQPLSDEQAIRIFQHLHSLRPTLHTLSIAATFHKLHGFSPMSWTVRDVGSSNTTTTNNNNTQEPHPPPPSSSSSSPSSHSQTNRPRRESLDSISGGKTELITRQAEKDYELVQLWVGGRRMTTRTRRFSFRKPYLRALSGDRVLSSSSSSGVVNNNTNNNNNTEGMGGEMGMDTGLWGDGNNDNEDDDAWIFGVDDPL